jgi:hypothetical protein
MWCAQTNTLIYTRAFSLFFDGGKHMRTVSSKDTSKLFNTVTLAVLEVMFITGIAVNTTKVRIYYAKRATCLR